jgi:hypothetical protein
MSNSTTTVVQTVLTLSSNGRVQGWVDQPNVRGTADILSNSLFTIFICTYTMLCLNVPAPNDTSWGVIKRKLFWMGIAISGPEFVLTYASGQWGTAKDSVKAFKKTGHGQWTIRHGFFADMGGFLLVSSNDQPTATSTSTPSTRFPVTSRHIHWLVNKGYMDMPEVSIEEMKDKSKLDTVAKVVTCFQVVYLVLQCIGRALQRLSITTLELSALAIVVCSIMTSACWWNKPADVMTPIKVYLKDGVTLDKIREEVGGLALKDWSQTPLDFIDDLRSAWDLNVQAFMKMPTGPQERPIPRLPNDRFPNLKGYQETILCVGTLLYAAIHLFGWNWDFPTRIELTLWRVSSMFLFGNTAAFWVCETLSAWWRVGRCQRLFYRLFWRSKLPDLEASLIQTQTPGEPKHLPLAFEFWSIFPLAWTYAAARLYLLVEAFVGLRAMEQSAFINVDWAQYVPHF